MRFYSPRDIPITIKAGTFVQIDEVCAEFSRVPTNAEKTVFWFATGRSIEPAIMGMKLLGWFDPPLADAR